jgi:hypothetical protein
MKIMSKEDFQTSLFILGFLVAIGVLSYIIGIGIRVLVLFVFVSGSASKSAGTWSGIRGVRGNDAEGPRAAETKKGTLETECPSSSEQVGRGFRKSEIGSSQFVSVL